MDVSKRSFPNLELGRGSGQDEEIQCWPIKWLRARLLGSKEDQEGRRGGSSLEIRFSLAD